LTTRAGLSHLRASTVSEVTITAGKRVDDQHLKKSIK